MSLFRGSLHFKGHPRLILNADWVDSACLAAVDWPLPLPNPLPCTALAPVLHLHLDTAPKARQRPGTRLRRCRRGTVAHRAEALAERDDLGLCEPSLEVLERVAAGVRAVQRPVAPGAELWQLFQGLLQQGGCYLLLSALDRSKRQREGEEGAAGHSAMRLLEPRPRARSLLQAFRKGPTPRRACRMSCQSDTAVLNVASRLATSSVPRLRVV